MCKLFLPQMSGRHAGIIVNVSSGTDMFPLPLMDVYAASKVTAMSGLLKSDLGLGKAWQSSKLMKNLIPYNYSITVKLKHKKCKK